jgi:single-stranded DNA-binding protein
MSVFVLVSGTLFKTPEQRSSAKSGKLFTVATVKAGSDTGAGDFWSVTCFSESAQLELLRLEVGDAISVRGRLEIKTYTAANGETKIGRSIVADAALGLRPVPRTPKAKAAPAGSKAADAQSIIPPSSESSTDKPASSFFDDEIPF